jgi:molybdopterin/thiamine biosynthesis adenylyltransferase
MAHTNQVDTLRHQNEFSLALLQQLRVDIIGCGATAVRVALEVAGLGVQQLHLWDFDHIETHNVANQLQVYGIPDIGRHKADVLAERIEYLTGLKPIVHREAADGTQRLGQAIFLLTDTIASRQAIWQKGIRRKLGKKLMIETRLAAWEYQVYTIDPMRDSHIRGWEAVTDYGDDDPVVEVGVCRAQTTIGGTATQMAGVAVNQFIRWLKLESGTAVAGERIEQQRVVCARTGESMRVFFDDVYGAVRAA